VQSWLTTAGTSTLEGNDNVFTGANDFTQPIQYAGATGLTALCGGGKAGLAITEGYNNYTTVATSKDSAQLPVGELKSPQATIAITGATMILSDYAGQLNLEQINKLKPVVTSIRQGIDLALKVTVPAQ